MDDIKELFTGSFPTFVTEKYSIPRLLSLRSRGGLHFVRKENEPNLVPSAVFLFLLIYQERGNDNRNNDGRKRGSEVDHDWVILSVSDIRSNGSLQFAYRGIKTGGLSSL